MKHWAYTGLYAFMDLGHLSISPAFVRDRKVPKDETIGKFGEMMVESCQKNLLLQSLSRLRKLLSELSSPDAFRRQTGGYHEDAASDDPEISLGSSQINLVILFGYCHAPRIFLLIKQMRH
ncbi:hypothetical protein NC652_020666 [Populus alba x Populus x berolinensis]|nr:hypothetical protein NC652_020666 [Populus alba x Populus x berolinensis]